MSKKNLQDLLAARTNPPERDIITPVNLTQLPADKSTSGQGDTGRSHAHPDSSPVDLATSPHVDKPTDDIGDKAASQQVNRRTSPQLDRYTTYVKPGMRKLIKRTALDQDVKDYDIVIQALEEYFKSRGLK